MRRRGSRGKRNRFLFILYGNSEFNWTSERVPRTHDTTHVPEPTSELYWILCVWQQLPKRMTMTEPGMIIPLLLRWRRSEYNNKGKHWKYDDSCSLIDVVVVGSCVCVCSVRKQRKEFLFASTDFQIYYAFARMSLSLCRRVSIVVIVFSVSALIGMIITYTQYDTTALDAAIAMLSQPAPAHGYTDAMPMLPRVAATSSPLSSLLLLFVVVETYARIIYLNWILYEYVYWSYDISECSSVAFCVARSLLLSKSRTTLVFYYCVWVHCMTHKIVNEKKKCSTESRRRNNNSWTSSTCGVHVETLSR